MKVKRLLAGWALIVIGGLFCYGFYGHDTVGVNFSDHPDHWQLVVAGVALMVAGVSVLVLKQKAE